MKKNFLKTMTIVIASTMMMSSCIGSFGLFNKVLDWNRNLSYKYVNELLFIIISPAYAVCGTIDLLVLNSVEFWSGTNPIAKAGHVENVWGRDGKMYAVKTLKNGYEITKPTGDKVLFTFDAKTQTWSMEGNGIEKELLRFNEDGTVRTYLPDGSDMDVSLNEEGVYSVRMAINEGTYFAAR